MDKTLDGMLPKNTRIRVLADLLLSAPTRLRGAFRKHAALAGAGRVAGFLALTFIPALVSAHEVYVLDGSTIASDIATVSPSPLLAFANNEYQFFLWGFVCFVGFSTIFFMSIFHLFEEWADPILHRLKRYAPLIERVTLGLSLIAFAYNAALFGPELPLVGIYGGFTPLVQIFLYAAGACILLGVFTRTAAFIVGLVSLVSIPVHGWYMLTYTAYFVVVAAMFIMGSGRYSLERALGLRAGMRELARRFEPYEMLVLRIGFGFSVIAAAVYAKYLHTTLALDVIRIYHLTNYFHFDPLFIVLGAFIIETLIGIFIILGIEIRWTAIFFLFWLSLSLWYFGEGVWPHLALFGLNFMLFFHGYDRYSIEGRFFKKHGLEPVL